MSDEFDLDKLTKTMQDATPAPDPSKRDADIALSETNFEKIHAGRQGSADAARPTSERSGTPGFFQGVKQMLNTISTKGFLTATTSVAALGLAVFVVLPDISQLDGLRNGVENQPVTVTDPATTPTEPARITETQQAPAEIRREADAREISKDDNVAASVAEPVMETEEMVFIEEPVMAEPMADLALGQSSATAERSRLMPGTEGIVGGIVSAPPQPAFADHWQEPEPNTEAFANEAANPVKIASEEPVSTFSVDVDTASYAVVRSSLSQGYLPPRDAVRAEELINYFPYAYPAPEGEHPFARTVTVTPTPWNDGTNLVHIAIQGELPETEARPPLNLVFLIDTSGSMNNPDKLPLLIQSFRLMLSELRPTDSVSIVTYAGSAGQVLKPTSASERATILNALQNLRAGGSTAGQAGLQQAYAVAESMAEDGEISRVILATDGDFNVGLSDPEALKDYIADKRESGTYLSVLGFGRGNLDDATMQALAQNGNGTASYIDTLEEAQKVLVDQLTGALFPIANDVKIQVEFNPAEIAEYRLIGYETRALRREDFNNDAIDAGEIGAGHSVTAIYEVTPVGSGAILNDALRYGAETTASESTGEIGYLKMRYKRPGEDVSQLIETPILPGMGDANTETRFATAIAGFAQLLQGSDYLGTWGYDEAIALAATNKGNDAFGYRAGAVTLMRLAESLSQN